MKIDLTDIEVQIVRNALALKRESLARARNKEVAGSAVFSAFTQQIAELDVISQKLGA